MINRSWPVLGAQGRFGDASGRARDSFGPPKCRPKADLGAHRAGQERPGDIQKRSRAARRRTQTGLEQAPSAFGASSTIERARGMNFRRFCIVVRKLRCMKNVAPANVLYTSHEVGTEHARAAKKFETEASRPRKSGPGASGRAKIEPRRPQSSGKARSKRLWGLRKIF